MGLCTQYCTASTPQYTVLVIPLIVSIPCPTYFLFWKCGNLNEILRDVDLLEFVLHLYEHLCFIYGKIIFQCSFRNGKSTTVLPYKNRIKPKYLVQMKFHLNSCTFKKGNTWGMGYCTCTYSRYLYCTRTSNMTDSCFMGFCFLQDGFFLRKLR